MTAMPDRAGGQGAAPDLSVVIPSVNDYSDLQRCLRALASDQGAALEIIVVDRLGELTRYHVRREFPEVTILAVAGGTPIPEMRAIGIRHAAAPFLGVIEDHVIVPPQWARRMLDAMEPGTGAVGGAIENAATETLIDWAAFLCEYSGTLPPLPAGPSDWLPGNNVIYRRDILTQLDAVLDEGKWENRLHDAIRAEGLTLLLRPDIVVGHRMHYSFGLYMSQRFLYSRSFAAARGSSLSASRRAAMGAAALVALPPLMFIRTIRRIVGKRRHLGLLVKSIPLLGAFVVSWGVGEAVGYWFGPGRSLSRVR